MSEDQPRLIEVAFPLKQASLLGAREECAPWEGCDAGDRI